MSPSPFSSPSLASVAPYHPSSLIRPFLTRAPRPYSDPPRAPTCPPCLPSSPSSPFLLVSLPAHSPLIARLPPRASSSNPPPSPSRRAPLSNMWKKLFSNGLDTTPQAPKHRPLPLPNLGEGGGLPSSPVPLSAIPPGLAGSWASSDSGSSSSSSSPTTPATSPAPWKRSMTPYTRPPSVRAETPQYEIRSPAWHVMTTDLDKSLCRQTFTPSPEIHKPRPRRASSSHHPTPVQVMQALVSPTPMPPRNLKGILKQCAYRLVSHMRR